MTEEFRIDQQVYVCRPDGVQLAHLLSLQGDEAFVSLSYLLGGDDLLKVKKSQLLSVDDYKRLEIYNLEELF